VKAVDVPLDEGALAAIQKELERAD
jgi:hypothetical protein